MTLLKQVKYKKIFFLLLLQFVCSLEAHNRSESYSKFQFLPGEVGVNVKVTGTIKQSIFEGLKPDTLFDSYGQFINYLGNSIDIGEGCKLNQAVEFNQNNAAGVLKFFWDFDCDALPSAVSISLFQNLGINHTHIARGSIDGQTIPEFMFASQSDVWLINALPNAENNQSSYVSYLLSGIEHILGGWDHLFFCWVYCSYFRVDF